MKELKYYIGNCESPPYTELEIKEELSLFCDFIDESEEIETKEFIENCELNNELLKAIIIFPNDFEFMKNGEVFFYRHSMIEYFFK